MTAFDAELYLRLLAERGLLGSSLRRDPWSSPLSTAAQALVAVEAIDPETAETVLDDYGLAVALRHGEYHHYAMRGHRARHGASAVELTPRRVVPCDRVIETQDGTMHVKMVSLDDNSTTVAMTCRLPARQPRHGRGMHPPFPQVTLADDQGTTAGAGFSGDGSEHEWRGHLHADRPLAKDTAWIEIDGKRIDFGDAEPVGDVAVEPLPEAPAALRHLWALLAGPDHFHGFEANLDPAIDALVAAGAVDPDDGELAELRAVAAIVHPHRFGGGGPQTRRLPEPWRSLLARRGREEGPIGTAAIGLVTPVFDGVIVAAIGLESDEDEFEVEVEVSPDVVMNHPYAETGARLGLAWWARDDRGNHYLGHANGWSSDGDRGHGEIAFGPALDPAATRLELLPTAETSRAVIGFPLPWATGDHAA